MKIMHLIHGLNTGGAETLVKDYALNFDTTRNDITVLCLARTKDSPYEKNLSDTGIRIIYVSDYLHYGKIINKIVRYLLVRKFIRAESPDILHAHLFVNRYVKFAKPDSNMKIFYTVHSEPEKIWFSGDRKRKKDFEATKWLIKHYDFRFIALHKKMKKEIENIFGVSSVLVLNNGIDISKYKNLKDKNIMRRELNIFNDAFVVGHIGRFAVQKNHDFVVDVFREIKKINRNAFLLMVGSGNERSNIENKLYEYGLGNSYLILSKRDDIPDILNTMDIFIFPSRFEGLGMALIEAQEAKLPCFVSDTIPEHATISNLITKLSLNIGPKKWAEVIEKYERPKKIVVNDEDWDIRRITKQLEKFYEEAIMEKKNGKK